MTLFNLSICCVVESKGSKDDGAPGSNFAPGLNFNRRGPRFKCLNLNLIPRTKNWNPP